MVDRIRRAGDTDGCACPACRGLRTAALQRSIGAMVSWSIRFLRSRPSVSGVFVVLVGVQAGLRFGAVGPSLLLGGLGFVGALFARGYVATLVAGQLSDREYPSGSAAAYTLRRLPAVLGTWILTFGAMLVVGGLVGGSLGLVLGPDIVTAAGRPAPSLSQALGSFVTVGTAILVIVKFVFASEAAVIGGYGPIQSLRVSWGLVSFRRRATVALVGLVTSMLASVVIWGGAGGATDGLWATVLDGVAIVLTMLGYAVSAVVLTHLYVRRVTWR
jgi:hypothetical protein